MRTRNFLVVSTTGRLLGTTLLSLQGSSLRNDQDVFFFILLGVTALIILGGYFHVGWWLKILSQEEEGITPCPSPSAATA